MLCAYLLLGVTCLAGTIGFLIGYRVNRAASFKKGYAKGFAEKYPDDSKPCGNRLNPHKWSAWQERNLTAHYISESRTCSVCGVTDARTYRYAQ